MNRVFIATSIDGYIADKDGKIDWLHSIPNPEKIDMGYHSFISSIDAIVMGRNTFETVLGFDIDWPYAIPVYVVSNTLKSIPNNVKGEISIIQGSAKEITGKLQSKGYQNLYIDGGATIQGFISEGMIDEMTITTIPVLLGGGIPLFDKIDRSQHFKCVSTELYLNSIVQSKFIRNP